jgi:mRNA interferase RelE/StbE
MPFELGFLEEALKEWGKLDGIVREQFNSKLSERLMDTRVPSTQLRGHAGRYKIKLSSVGYRLDFEVRDGQLLVVVIAIGKRERNAVYQAAELR